MKQNKALSLVGLATKAGKTVSGEFATEKSIKEKKACLVLIAEDASQNTQKKFRNMCTFYKTPMCIYETKIVLGKAIGKEFRASLAIEDLGFAKKITEHINVDCVGTKHQVSL